MATQIISIEVNVPPGKEISHVSEVVPLSGEPVTELIINFFIDLVRTRKTGNA